MLGLALNLIGRIECRKCQEDDKEHHHHQTSATNDMVFELIVFVITIVNIFVAISTHDFKCPPSAVQTWALEKFLQGQAKEGQQSLQSIQ